VAADTYDRFIGRYSPGLAAALLGAVRVAPGGRALDVGCGPGALTAALAGLLGAERVAAVDPSPPFVEACRAALRDALHRSLGEPGGPFTVGARAWCVIGAA
jgi:predicted RNA methylase